jgi:hypothetical protein
MMRAETNEIRIKVQYKELMKQGVTQIPPPLQFAMFVIESMP